MNKVKQLPIRLPTAGKREIRTQFGALCYRMRGGKLQVLVITTRSGKSWIVPKGWPMDNATPAQAAAREAWEEAGVEGKIIGDCLGIYSASKEVDGDELPCIVALFALKTKRVHAIYPERGQRKRKWLSRKKAAALLDNPELRQLVKNFQVSVASPVNAVTSKK